MVLQVLKRTSTLFPYSSARCTTHEGGLVLPGVFSGTEDPRIFWSPEDTPRPWLLVSAWSGDCQRLKMHLVKLPPVSSLALAAGVAADEVEVLNHGPDGGAGKQLPSQVVLEVAYWLPSYTVRSPVAELLQKNWVPFVFGGRLLAEYTLEPHIVLHVDPDTGRCLPLYTETSFAPLAALQRSAGRISGGAPPLLLPDRAAYLGLAHFKHSQRMPQLVGTRHMRYSHLFYTIAATPPFAVSAIGSPRTLPQPHDPTSTPTLQFAAGMTLDQSEEFVLVSYGVLDCSMHIVQIPLAEILADLGL